MEQPKKRRGIKRWFLLLFIILSIFAARAYPPIRPHIQLPAERLFPIAGNFYLTNTLVATLLADIFLFLLAFSVYRAVRSGKMVLTGIAGVIEAFLEVIYNLTESTAGKWAKQIFPWFATITLLVLVVNWMELIPGVDSIGLLEHAQEHGAEGYPIQQLTSGIAALVKGEGEHEGGYVVVPFVRVASTDLNFTLALALISVFMTQVLGIRALGFGYFTKFINTRTMFTRPVFGALDLAVGLLELISEFAKILSFSFRLFGNIFAGSVLLFVIGSLVPVFAQSAVLVFEFAVGLIQALVFGLLTLIFMSVATTAHGDEH